MADGAGTTTTAASYLFQTLLTQKSDDLRLPRVAVVVIIQSLFYRQPRTQDQTMDPASANDLSLLFDKDGFFLSPERWDIALAQRIASYEGMGEMDALQQELLLTLRDAFHKHGAVTALSHICHVNGLEADCLHQLFQSPRQAWRIAGLPNPGEEAKAYLA